MSGVPSEAEAPKAETPEESHRRRNALVVFLVILCVLAALVASVSLLSAPPGACTFSNESFVVSAPGPMNFSDCLPVGGSLSLGFTQSNSSVSMLNGTVTSEFPVRVQIVESPLGFEGVIYSQNDTTSAHFRDIHLLPKVEYAVIITNLGQNNSLSVNLRFS